MKVSGIGLTELAGGEWQVAPSEPGEHSGPAGIGQLDWMPARVPGTVAGALRDAGELIPGAALEDRDWWFRCSFDAPTSATGDETWLALDGVATVFEVFVNGTSVLSGDSMFAPDRAEIGHLLRDTNELVICCRALAPLLAVRRRPRARWRTKLVPEGNLRWFRTMLMGRAPGFAPHPPAIGPWRPVRVQRHSGVAVEEIELRPRLDGDEGVLAVELRLRDLGGHPTAVSVELRGSSGTHAMSLPLGGEDGDQSAAGELRVPGVARWWPHTHGSPELHDLRIEVQAEGGQIFTANRRVGFRALRSGEGGRFDAEEDGLDLHVNDVPIFCRGAVWTPEDLVSLGSELAAMRRTLELARDSGMNMIRIPGTAAYESGAFHDLCDELGILVWQDLMFANLDYPFADPDFRAKAEAEAREVIRRLAPRPSTTVVCGGSEVFQQAAMLGLDPDLARDDFYLDTLPSLLREEACDALPVPSSPCGGPPPFRPDRGVANYYGVGGYMRPLTDARLANLGFAAECLAFANVSDQEAGTVGERPGVPRDVGAEWDFADVRDHYLRELYEVEPSTLAHTDHRRYLELSRAASGEVMAAAFGEWRRAASPCRGALVLWLRDLLPGDGWGLIDSDGDPKPVLSHLRRVLAPRAVWLSDEGLSGVAVHVANDTPDRLSARLRIALYRDREVCVGETRTEMDLEAHRGTERNVEEMLGRFADVGWNYRFGPPAQDLVVASLEADSEDESDELVSQAFFFPVGRPTAGEPAEDLGLSANVAEGQGSTPVVQVSANRYVHCVRIDVPGFRAAEDCFGVEPGGSRSIVMHPEHGESRFAGGSLRALNLDEALPISATTPPLR